MKNDFPRIDVTPEIRRNMIEIAREFRKEPTPGEKIMLNVLRGKKLDGTKFRRQQPIGYFVVDLYSSAYRLVAEVDGLIHESQKEADAAQQEILELLGFNILRIRTEIVEQTATMALAQICESIRMIHQQRKLLISSPVMGEGNGGGM